MWISNNRLRNMLCKSEEQAFLRAKSYFDQGDSERRSKSLSAEKRIREEIFSLALVPPSGFGVGISAAKAITAILKFLDVDFSVPSSEVVLVQKGRPEQPTVTAREDPNFIFTGDHFYATPDGKYFHLRSGRELVLVPFHPPIEKRGF